MVTSQLYQLSDKAFELVSWSNYINNNIHNFFRFINCVQIRNNIT